MSHTFKKKKIKKNCFSNEQIAVTEMAILCEMLSKSLWIFQYNNVLLM